MVGVNQFYQFGQMVEDPPPHSASLNGQRSDLLSSHSRTAAPSALAVPHQQGDLLVEGVPGGVQLSDVVRETQCRQEHVTGDRHVTALRGTHGQSDVRNTSLAIVTSLH